MTVKILQPPYSKFSITCHFCQIGRSRGLDVYCSNVYDHVKFKFGDNPPEHEGTHDTHR
jgi:hypothetical protein